MTSRVLLTVLVQVQRPLTPYCASAQVPLMVQAQAGVGAAQVLLPMGLLRGLSVSGLCPS